MTLFRIAAFLLPVFLGGCIGEDMDNCPDDRPPENNLVLKFSYVIGGDGDIFTRRVEQTELFIFNGNGSFLRQHTITTGSLDAGQSAALSLAPGSYRIVCWGNALDRTGIGPLSPNTLLEDAYIFNSTLHEGRAVNCDPLYYATSRADDGSGDYRFTVPETGTITQTLHFTCAHIKMHVFVSGFSDPDGQGGDLPPIVEVEALETNGDFNMRPFGPAAGYAQPADNPVTKETEYAAAYFNLPPFNDDNSLKLRVKRSSDQSAVTEISIKEYMAANGLTVENVEEALISIHISYGGPQNTEVTISLPEWGNSPVIPEL